MSAGKMEGGAGVWIGTVLVIFNSKIGVYRSLAIYPLNGMIDESLLQCVPIAIILAIWWRAHIINLLGKQRI